MSSQVCSIYKYLCKLYGISMFELGKIEFARGRCFNCPALDEKLRHAQAVLNCAMESVERIMDPELDEIAAMGTESLVNNFDVSIDPETGERVSAIAILKELRQTIGEVYDEHQEEAQEIIDDAHALKKKCKGPRTFVGADGISTTTIIFCNSPNRETGASTETTFVVRERFRAPEL